MKKLTLKIAAVAAIFVSVWSCNSEDESNPAVITKQAVIENYANIVYQNYKDSYDSAVEMQTAITSFTENPTQAGLDEVKSKWLAAREIYGQSEVFRGSDGPIDSASGESWVIDNEGQMNAWPLDEGYIDYVTSTSTAYAGDYSGGIIAGTTEITEDYLIGQNEGINDKSISTGWHAIEFLIWGQDETDPSEVLAGQRPLTDYTTDALEERRKTYLNVVTSILVKDLNDLVNTWANGGTYYNVFMNLSEDDAISRIMSGPFFLANEELAEERMTKPADLTDGINNSGQEDEHSCFADNTHRDVVTNAQGIVNVIFGEYGTISGASVYDLIEQENATVAAALMAAKDSAMAKINVIDTKANDDQPFDVLLQNESIESPGPIIEAGLALKNEFGANISAGATAIGINLL